MQVMITGILILLARVCDVSLGTIRILLLMHGYRLYAALTGFVECLIFIFILGTVMQHLDNPVSLVFYSLGFALGNYFGGLLEEKIAIGHVTIQIISNNCWDQLEKEIRKNGYGVTVVKGHGMDHGERNILNILLKRKNLPHLLKIVESMDQKCFITIMDTRTIYGGVFPQPAYPRFPWYRRNSCHPAKF